MNASLRVTATFIAVSCAASALLVAQERRPETAKRPATEAVRRPEARERPEADEAAEHVLTGAQVPMAVKQAFRRAYPNASVQKYSSEVENGQTVYELETVEGTVRRDLLITAAGVITETETTVSAEQLPAPVRTAATARNGQIERAEVVVAGRDTTYEVHVRGRAEMKLRADGRPVPASRN